MNTAYLLTGGNVGNRQQYLHQTANLIEATCGTIAKRSAIYETAPWGKTDQEPFLNQALELITDLSPAALMNALLRIELLAGRQRSEKYGPRTIDIDILLYNQDIVESKLVTIPHPQMIKRRFVLEPLAAIAPDYYHPVLKKTIAVLLLDCADTLPVKKFSGV